MPTFHATPNSQFVKKPSKFGSRNDANPRMNSWVTKIATLPARMLWDRSSNTPT